MFFHWLHLLSFIFHSYLLFQTILSGLIFIVGRTGSWSLPLSPRRVVSLMFMRLTEQSDRSSVEELELWWVVWVYVLSPGVVIRARFWLSSKYFASSHPHWFILSTLRSGSHRVWCPFRSPTTMNFLLSCWMRWSKWLISNYLQDYIHEGALRHLYRGKFR